MDTPEERRAKIFAAAKLYKKNNPEKIRAASAVYYAKNKELLREKKRIYRLNNVAKVAAQRTAYYEANKEQIQARARPRRAVERKRFREKYPWYGCLSGASNRSKNNSIPFDLTKEWVLARWTGKCEISGMPFSIGTGSTTLFSPSIDRINPHAGYIQTNCRFILFGINSFKGAGTEADMRRIAKAITEARPKTDAD